MLWFLLSLVWGWKDGHVPTFWPLHYSQAQSQKNEGLLVGQTIIQESGDFARYTSQTPKNPEIGSNCGILASGLGRHRFECVSCARDSAGSSSKKSSRIFP